MLNSRWIYLTLLVSASSFGAVSFKEKELRVASLMKMQRQLPTIAFEAYQRELSYESRGLTQAARIHIESNLVAEKVRFQVQSAFKEAIKEHQNVDLAHEEVKNAIEQDLELADPEMREELMNVALEALENTDSDGGMSSSVELNHISKSVAQKISERQNFLNQEDITAQDPIAPKANPHKDSERKDYKSTKELVESLVSDRENSRWVSTANQSVKTAQIVKADGQISLQVKMEFLGATLEAGPTITFKRDLSTDATIMTEGLHPVILKDGTFDRFKKGALGEVVINNNKSQMRYIAFYCNLELKFETEYKGSGGFKYMGLGADASVSKIFQNVVSLQSRRIALPETVGNKTVTVKSLSEICQKDFAKGRITKSMTVRQSLDAMMRNVVAGLVFSHPKTKCAFDAQCLNWFEKDVISLQKNKNTVRCVENSRDKFRFCQIRGKVGQSCPVIEGGKKTSSGENEYPCDWGLKCVKVSNESKLLGFGLSSSKGQCKR